MRKKILITTESLIVGGVETALISLVKYLNTMDVEIDISVLGGGIFMDELKKINNVNIIPVKIPKNPIVSRVFKNLLCNSLYKKYKKNNTKKYDIAIAYYGINNYCDLYAAASNAKEKYLWVHNNFDAFPKFSFYKLIFSVRNKIMSRKFKYFDKIVAVSESSRKGFCKIFPKYSDKTIVVNNIMDYARLDGRYEKCDFKMKGSNKLLYVGRLAPIKRVDLLINEFEKVLSKLNNSILYIVGDGTERKKLELIVNEKKLQNNVIFLGNQKNPFKYMEQADVLVSASSMEAYSINTLEALAMQKYFVNANNPGAKDIFYYTNEANFNNGIVCDVEDMHHHIIYYLRNKKNIKPKFDISNANKLIEEELKRIFDLNEKKKS